MLKEYFTTQFLFSINRIQILPVDKFFLFVGVVALVLAGLFKFAVKSALSPVDKKYRQKLCNVFLFLAISEIIWYGARVQLVRFFGSHFVALLLFGISVVWLALVLWKMFKTYRKEKVEWEKEQVKRKYLPN